jgi:cysteine desulfurase
MIRSQKPSIRRVYADYQASTPVDEAVLSGMAKYYRESPANPHADDHAMGWEAAEAITVAKARLAACLNCDAEEIVFTSGATEANNLAVLGAAAGAPLERKRILLSAVEHKSVSEPAGLAALRFGCRVQTIPVDSEGVVIVEELERALSDDVLLVAMMAVNNEVGAIQPVEKIGRLCAQVGAIFHTDAAQALATAPLDVASVSIGSTSLSGHKIYGPKGIGALYLRLDIQDRIEPMIVGGGQQAGLRAGTLPVPLCVGLSLAAERMGGTNGSDEKQRVATLRNSFAEPLLKLSTVALNGPPLHQRHPGNCNLRFDGWEAKHLLGRLQPQLAASTGSACTSGTDEPSYVLRAMGLTHEQAASSIRFSFGRFSTMEDVEHAVDLLKSILTERR